MDHLVWDIQVKGKRMKCASFLCYWLFYHFNHSLLPFRSLPSKSPTLIPPTLVAFYSFSLSYQHTTTSTNTPLRQPPSHNTCYPHQSPPRPNTVILAGAVFACPPLVIHHITPPKNRPSPTKTQPTTRKTTPITQKIISTTRKTNRDAQTPPNHLKHQVQSPQKLRQLVPNYRNVRTTCKWIIEYAIYFIIFWCELATRTLQRGQSSNLPILHKLTVLTTVPKPHLLNIPYMEVEIGQCVAYVLHLHHFFYFILLININFKNWIIIPRLFFTCNIWFLTIVNVNF